MKLDRLEGVRIELGLNKTQFAELMGITNHYYSNILRENGKGNLRLEHLENLLANKGVNPTWIITGEGEKYITKKVGEAVNNPDQKNQPVLPVVTKKDLIKAVLKFTDVMAVPGDLSYEMLDNLVSKTLSSNPDLQQDHGRATGILSQAWLSMLEFVQQMLHQNIEFEYQGKKYTFHQEED